jgi:hypothetical protein
VYRIAQDEEEVIMTCNGLQQYAYYYTFCLVKQLANTQLSWAPRGVEESAIQRSRKRADALDIVE